MHPSPLSSQNCFSSPVGQLEISISDRGISSLKLSPKESVNTARSSLPPTLRNWLEAYFRGDKPDTGVLRFDLSGTPFQLKIWRMLMNIPYGATVSYGYIAREFTRNYHKTSPRAVGQAIARNPVWILIPCHRVIAANGALGGYAGGLAMKKYLLALENKFRSSEQKVLPNEVFFCN